MGLEDYKELVASCASICTMGQMLSGTLICKDIYQKGSSEGFDSMPFLGGVGMCILMLQYAWILKDIAMINVNVFGLLTNMAYMAVFYYYSPHTKDILALIGKATTFVMVFLAYAQVESPEKIEFRFGLIVTVLLLLLVAFPLVHLRKIIETKNTDILPFPIIFMGTIVTFLWLLYGLIINNVFIIFQNSVAFVLSLAQLSLFVIYPSKSKNKESTQKKAE
ncbi:sugar transporter SWEET1 [Apis mellifera caucasica]|uniref:Sugar transporter SWEET n=1 Tax=Apis mellifera TaxID=7460 RepID=A0A7M7R553_APIME|nr:sugar transporter SWEET1 [Apis mellifera]KAG6800640.1 sugar transporter SWEET1 [Apis mellifera caucasica]KAG9433592.1 sugar transporter SWEET1 [Apis mellifera carnica]|eukprot:XP_392667.2 sugar transporter SWEET1 [Apis mellifera]